MSNFTFHTYAPEQYSIATPPSQYVNRDDRPNTPDQVSPFSLADRPSTIFYYADNSFDPNNPTNTYATPLNSSPIPPLLLGILLILTHKLLKNKFRIPPK